MVASDVMFEVQFGASRENFVSHFDELHNTAVIVRSDYIGGFYSTGGALSCMIGGTSNAPQSLGGLVAHELIGHGAGALLGGRPAPEPEAISVENLYHAGASEPARCLQDHM